MKYLGDKPRGTRPAPPVDVHPGDDGENPDAQEPTDGDERPEECECAEFHTDVELPCWPCYRDGFNTPPPEEDP